MSEHLRREQDEINAYDKARAHESRQELAVLLGRATAKISELSTSMEYVLARLHALEEKERQRAREDHDREALLDGKELLLIEKYLDFLEDGGNPANWQEGVE